MPSSVPQNLVLSSLMTLTWWVWLPHSVTEGKVLHLCGSSISADIIISQEWKLVTVYSIF